MNDIKSIIQENNTVLVKMLDQCVADIKEASDLSILAIKNGNKIIWCGNGGSAADAQESIKNISNHILQTKGGDGVIRELLDLINK